MTDWMLGPINEQSGCKADQALVACAHSETMESHFDPPHDGEVIPEPQRARGLASGDPVYLLLWYSVSVRP